MKKNAWDNISWKTRKHLAEMLCVLLVVLSMVLSLCRQTTYKRPDNDEGKTSLSEQPVQAKVENNGATASLKINIAQIENKAGEDIEEIEEKETILEASDNKSDMNDSKDTWKNNVVSEISKSGTGSDKSNTVVKNPTPFSLISGIFENHGTKPEWGDRITKYQYPVEIGYPVDNNYDGKQDQKSVIQDMVFNTTAEDEMYDDNRDEADSGEEGNQTTEDAPSSVTEENPDNSEDAVEKEGNGSEGEETAVTENTTEYAEGSRETSEAEEKTTDTKESSQSSQFQKEIWSKILPTEPVDIHITKEDTDTEEIQTVEASEDEEQEAAPEAVEADNSFFIVNGKMRVDSQVFVSDIKIKPTGKDGFDKVRIGEQGDFQSSVLLTKDANKKDVELYFSDGERVTTGVTFSYSKDTANPALTLKEDAYHILQSGEKSIYCTNNTNLDVVLEDGTEGSGVAGLCCVYGDKLVYLTDIADKTKPSLLQDFYGRVLMNCTDQAGNVSAVSSEYFLLEQNAPDITFSQDEICTLPYTLWIDVEENGHIVSGLENIECTVNGESVEITNLEAREVLKLDDQLEVPAKAAFSMKFDEEGEFTVQVKATDNAGNTIVKEQTVHVTKPEFVSVYMPEAFTIHIDPQRLLGKEQIFSDNIELKNVSDFDVRVKIDSIDLYVNDEKSDTGILKDCEVYLVAPDTGEKIKIKKGENKEVYSYRLPKDAIDDITNLYFVGNTTEGSDEMWRSSDISIEVKLSFEKWRE